MVIQNIWLAKKEEWCPVDFASRAFQKPFQLQSQIHHFKPLKNDPSS